MSSDSQDRESPRLLDQVRELIRIRRYSVRTEQAYVQWIRRYILFHDKRHPLRGCRMSSGPRSRSDCPVRLRGMR